MDLSDTGSRSEKIKSLLGRRWEERVGHISILPHFVVDILLKSNSFSFTSYDLDDLCFLLAESVVLTCRLFWGPVFHSIPELSITLEDTVT